jgi:IS30 family transposase
VDFPDDESMRISHEAIYQALFVQGRGALRRELVACRVPGVRCESLELGLRGEGRSS